MLAAVGRAGGLAAVAARPRAPHPRGGRRPAGAAVSERDDPKALDRQAAAAEAAGDLEAALRLRFRAGLLRLDARGAIVFRPSISTHEVRRALRSDAFDALAATFDDVVYGGRPPSDADVAAARDRWPAIIKGTVPATRGDAEDLSPDDSRGLSPV